MLQFHKKVQWQANENNIFAVKSENWLFVHSRKIPRDITTFVQRKLRAVSHQTYTFYHFFKWRYCQEECRKRRLFCCWHLFCSRWCRRWWWFWPSHSWTQFSQLFLFLCCWFLTQLQSWPKITINWSVTLLDSFCWSQPGLRTRRELFKIQDSEQTAAWTSLSENSFLASWVASGLLNLQY